MLSTGWLSTCTCSGVKRTSVLTAAGVWVKNLVLLAAALQTFFALKATAVFRVLNEISRTWCFTDALTAIFIKRHVRSTESGFLEVRVVFCPRQWSLVLQNTFTFGVIPQHVNRTEFLGMRTSRKRKQRTRFKSFSE